MLVGPCSLEGRLRQLVGEDAWRAAPDLQTSAAYDVAWNVIYNALPDCRHGPGECFIPRGSD
jgi:hypothetical protein